MLHLAADETETWMPDASRVPMTESQAILERYLSEWRQLATTYGGDAHLLDEEFVGGTGPGMPQGAVIPKPAEYFHDFYDARESYAPYIKAACRVRNNAGNCTDQAGTLEPMGAFPRPEKQGLLDAIMNLETFLSLGKATPWSLKPPSAGRSSKIAAVAAGAVGLGLLVAGLVKASRRRA